MNYDVTIRKTVADEVISHLIKRAKLPDNLLEQIYLGILAHGAKYEKQYTPDFSLSIERQHVVICYVTSLLNIFDQLPEWGQSGPFRVRISDVVTISPRDALYARLFYEPTPRAVKDFEGSPVRFLRGTVYELVLDYPIYLTIPIRQFYQHIHVMANSGFGKTTLLERLVYRNIQDDVCIFCIAPKGLLLPQIARLDFDPSRLTYFSPKLWKNWVPGLNPFKLFGENPTSAQVNHICDFVNYLFSDLDPTNKQKSLLNNCTRLLVKIQGASLLTLYQWMGFEKFPEHLHRYLDPRKELQLSFFLNDFGKPKQYGETKEQLKWRIQALLDNEILADAIAQPRCDFDIMHLLSNPSVILIDTAFDYVGEDGSNFLGRFFFAMLTMAMRIRGAGEHQPVVAYIDECASYLDDNIETMLELARDSKIGLVLIHQYLQQLRKHSTSLEAAVVSQTRTKFIGNASHSDAVALSHTMMVEPRRLEQQDDFEFHFKVGVKKTVRIRTPHSYLKGKPQRQIGALYKKLLSDARQVVEKQEPGLLLTFENAVEQAGDDNDIE